MKLRISRLRREFGTDSMPQMERDAGEQPLDIKPVKNMAYITKKKVLDMGLQAANQMLRFQSQTYVNRMVNKAVLYDPNDFIDQMKNMSQQDTNMNEKLEKFIDRVAFRIEEALQSNELINVF